MFTRLLRSTVRKYILRQKDDIVKFVEAADSIPVPPVYDVEKHYDLLYKPIYNNVVEILHEEGISDDPDVALKLMLHLAKGILDERDI